MITLFQLLISTLNITNIISTTHYNEVDSFQSPSGCIYPLTPHATRSSNNHVKNLRGFQRKTFYSIDLSTATKESMFRI